MEDFETTVLQLVTECELDLAKLERRKATVNEQVASVQQEIAGLQAGLRRHRANLGIAENVRIDVDEELRQRFAGLTSRDVLVVIANDNNGRLVGKEAYVTMMKAGMFKNERGASNAFFRVMSRNPHLFDKVKRGVYQLVDSAAQQWADTLPPPPELMTQRTA